MKIIVAHSRYRSGSMSGENRVVEDEVSLLRAAGHDVQTWTPSVDEGGITHLVKAGAAAVWSKSASDAIVELVQRHRPDVVHYHNLFPALSPSVLRATDTPAVVTLHNFRLLCLPATFLRDGKVCEDCLGHAPWRGVVHACYRDSIPASAAIATSIGLHRAARTFTRPDLYLAVSRFVRDKHVAAGFSPERIKVKPNFTWPSERRDGAGRYFLFVGRLSREKGLDNLLAAFERLPGVPLVVVGDGDEGQRLRALAPSNVEFRGAVEPAALAALFRDARALVFPSTCYEGSPRAVIEAFAAGVPVIASRMGGIPELVDDGRSGLLVPPDDPHAWVRAIERLLDNTESQRLGEGARDLWEQEFAPERALKNLESAYNDVVASRSDIKHSRTRHER